jgi:ribosome recycling factor
MENEAIDAMVEKMDSGLKKYQKDLAKIRTGRASLAILDGVQVDAYGSQMPLVQVASLTIPESRLIVIQPWDMQLLSAVEKAIFKADLGLTPANDGKLLRISIPQLTEERRKELVKQVKKLSEDYRVSFRGLRREANDLLKKQKKNKEIAEDDLFKLQEETQNKIDIYIKKIEAILLEKEKEVMEV